MIRDVVKNWDAYTPIEEILNQRRSIYKQPYAMTIIRTLSRYNPDTLKYPMIGEITNNLSTDEGAVIIKMTGMLDKLYKIKPDFDLVDFLAMIIERVSHKYNGHINNVSDWDMNVALTRTLRALPSFLREIDLEEQLKKRLPNAKFARSEDIDIKEHADVKLTLNGQTYYIWSYVSTEKGSLNAYKKLLGKSGEIPNGKHLLVPYDLKYDGYDINGWKFPNEKVLDLVKNKIESEQVDITFEQLRSMNNHQLCENILMMKK